ncbi:eukaryotic translation initiation factor 4 gamma 2-like, partial [Littorina saxatilis]|uniref:eukaryotic translation initiation factor 4 gamma 2-like n=1 Tax=Littorina saxatilis TaxID=31220 RepID=UPI0038B41B41
RREQSLFSFFLFPRTAAEIFGGKISSILDSKYKKGGVSPHSGGQDERPPTHFTVSRSRGLEAIPRWVPPSVVRRDAGSPNGRHDYIFRRVRGILNKLTPEKFDKLSLELLNVGIDSQVVLRGVILLIFDKALEEPKYSKLYAQLCHRLCEDVPNFEPAATSSISSFRRLLLNKCQDEFENRSKATEVFDKKDGPLTEEENDQYLLAKEKMLGNIKFIGELGKLDMLHEGILHKCIQQLLEKKKNTAVRDMAEDLECLCKIMQTVGPRLDSPRAKALIDQYFFRIHHYAKHEDLPSRIRFMLQDAIELRANEWTPRQVATENGPKTITAIRQEANKGQHGSKVFSSQMTQMNGMGHQWKGFGDIFSIPVGAMSNTIGTGPGVIQVDNFAHSQFSGNMGGGGGGGGGGRGGGRGGDGMGRNRGNQENQGFHQNNNFRNRKMESNGSPQNQRHNNQNQQHNNQQGQQPQNRQGMAQRENIPPRFQRMAQQQQGGPGGKGLGQTMSGQPPMAMGGPGGPGGGMMSSLPPVTGGLLNSKEELSLRPQKNFMFKPMTPAMLPRSAQAAPSAPLTPIPGTLSLSPKKLVDVANPPINPILAKQPIIRMKPAKEEKPKPQKIETISKDELKDKVPDLLNDFFTKQDLAETVSAIKDLKIPKRLMPDFLCQFMVGSVNKTESEQDEVMKLISALKADKAVSSDQFMESFKMVADQMSDLEQDTPLIKSHVARFGAQALACEVVTLAELADPFHNGVHYPLFLLCLQSAHRVKDKQWLVGVFNESKINLQEMLPEIDQKKERMLEILEDRGLSFMFPLMRVQSELGRAIAAEPSAGAIFKWIKDRVDPQLFTDPKFINILMTSIVKYITGESTLAEGADPNATPDKPLMDKEKDLLEKLKGVIQKFLLEHIDLQVAALYAVQVFSHNNNFPKGMLLRFFVTMYDQEIIEEEAFLLWKEEVNDEYPGKGKALFQVNQWLTWLEQAEAESEEEDDE